jgi:hypothetical protein
MRFSVVAVEGYRWLTLTPQELSACPAKYILVHVHGEESRRTYILPESFIDP